MSQNTTDSPPRPTLGIDWRATTAGALAAVSSAVLLSTLGAAGTLIGAALGSVIVTIASAVYRQGLETSRRQLARAQAIARQKVGVAQAEVRRANRADDTRAQESHLAHADTQLARANAQLDAAAAVPLGPTWRERLAALPWKRIALLAAAVFVVAVLLITAFELLSGRSVSSFTGGSGGGGTTIGDIGGGGGSGPRQHDQQPGDDTTPSQPPTGPASPTPTEESTPAESPSPTGSAEVTPTPTPTPTESPSPTGGERPFGSPTPPEGSIPAYP